MRIGRRCEMHSLLSFYYELLTSDRYRLQDPRREGYSDASTIKSALDAELGTKSNECPSATIHGTRPVSSSNERHLQLTLTPLERYRYHAQAYEQLATGQITDRRSLARLSELDETLGAAAILVTGFTSQPSGSSSPAHSSTLGGDSDELGGLLTIGSPDLQAASREEESKYITCIAVVLS
ncbi:hypothetical protein GGR58DRAFT_489023 [Xylaria digitata]|nr:hypothetical protein GGR58DRAFT_489023 [Xylaria digitata]